MTKHVNGATGSGNNSGNEPSAIFGKLNSNGQVFLINPSGVLFGRGAEVNVGGLVASTLNLSDADFLAGKRSFAGTSTAAINNLGTINADGGHVALLGTQVVNQGTIQARLGTVVLDLLDSLCERQVPRWTGRSHRKPPPAAMGRQRQFGRINC